MPKLTKKGSKAIAAAKKSPDYSPALGPTERPKGKVVPTSVHLPLAYLRILDTEANRLSIRRGALLTLLIQRKLQGLGLERPKDIPPYEFTDEELSTSKLYLWYITPEVRKMVDEDRLQMGITSISTWITQMLNHWIGRPMGLRSKSAK